METLLFKRGTEDINSSIGIGKTETIRNKLEELVACPEVKRLYVSAEEGHLIRGKWYLGKILHIKLDFQFADWKHPDDFLIQYLDPEYFVWANISQERARNVGSKVEDSPFFRIEMLIKNEYADKFPNIELKWEI